MHTKCLTKNKLIKYLTKSKLIKPQTIPYSVQVEFLWYTNIKVKNKICKQVIQNSATETKQS